MSEVISKHPYDSGNNNQYQKHSPGSIEELDFHVLGESIIESLDTAVVVFDLQLKTIQSNSHARELIDIGEYIDETLERGTGRSICDKWTGLLKAVISTGQRGDFESVRYSVNGRKKLLRIVCSVLRENQTQKIIGGILVIEDISEKINIEHQMAQTERLAAVGKVAGKVAHELNSPIDGILRYVNLAARIIDHGNPEKAKEYLQHSRQGLLRIVNIVSELLEFSRSAYLVFEYAAVDEIIEDAIKAMKHLTDQVKIQIIRDYSGIAPRIKGPNLFQVFCNLTKNAADAMSGKGELRITICRKDGQLSVEFRDNGPGFSPENAEKIFEPFFTTKGRGRGTGLGLAICKDIIEKYSGQITAENTPDAGSIFTVYLPLTLENS